MDLESMFDGELGGGGGLATVRECVPFVILLLRMNDIPHSIIYTEKKFC